MIRNSRLLLSRTIDDMRDEEFDAVESLVRASNQKLADTT